MGSDWGPMSGEGGICPGPMPGESEGNVGLPMFQCIVGKGHMESPLNKMTDTCENITFPQLRLRAVIIIMFKVQ